MDIKYYTPTLEEFHVGFRYEKLSLSQEKPVAEVDWFKEVLEDSLELPYIEEDLDDGILRVKYLDQDDLEELGWELDGCMKKSGCIYFKSNFTCITESPYDKKIVIQQEGDMIFYGYCKNYNELERLMKQLNIEK